MYDNRDTRGVRITASGIEFNKKTKDAQAVRRRLPTAPVRVRAQVRSCGICGGQTGIGARFPRVLRFPLPIFIPPIAPQSP
jgi:hypothetical protein